MIIGITGKKHFRIYHYGTSYFTKDLNKWLAIRFTQEGQVDPKIC